jgi:folate-binding Fe-S cluster repair protein YgfZ
MTTYVSHHRLEGRRVYRLTGSESRDLLQRISTADLTSLSVDRPVATLLTDE